jgi:hypothetical protein
VADEQGNLKFLLLVRRREPRRQIGPVSSADPFTEVARVGH